MRVWMCKDTGNLYLVRKWFEPLTGGEGEPQKGWHVIDQVGWLVLGVEGGHWLGGPHWIENGFEDLGEFNEMD